MNKKILLPIAALAMITVASCDMDKEPYSSIPDTEALETPTDFSNAGVGLYSGLRSCVGAGSFYNAPDIQCDEFDAVAGFSGAYSDIYQWDINTSTSYMETVYANYQTIISRANFIIDGYNKCDMSNPNLWTSSALADVSNIKGEAFFTRAYCLFGLAQYFCADYEDSEADAANSGVSYRTDYAPSSDASTYPARKTLRETYKQITDDLDSAAVRITATGEPSAKYATVDAVKALQARVALAMDNYALAAQKAVEVINTGNYRLASGVTAMQNMWWGNVDTESIFKLAVTGTSDMAGQTGQSFLPYTSSSVPNYIPTQTLIDLYSDNDCRKSTYFERQAVTTSTGAAGTPYLLNKYTEKGYLYTNVCANSEYARFMIEPKVIRISEMYLIAAEAYTQAGNTTLGAQYLNTLEGQRISGYTAQSFTTANSLMAEIRNERQREFVGEGMRLFDLKRWKLGVQRGTPQQENLCNNPGSNTTNLVRNADNNRFVWPIPIHETDANPQIKQNPGY